MYTSVFFFQTAEKYEKILEASEFSIEYIREYDCHTPLEDGEHGLEYWLRQFFFSELHALPEAVQQKLLRAVEDCARPELWDGTRWIADYRRLLAVAVKNTEI